MFDSSLLSAYWAVKILGSDTAKQEGMLCMRQTFE